MGSLKATWVLIGVTGALAAVAVAASFDETPSATDSGNTLIVRGTLADLSTASVTVRVRANGMATVTCVNRGGNEPPGQDRTRNVRVTVNGAQTIPASNISNGATSFEVATGVPAVSARAATCPSGQWNVEVSDVRFDAAMLRVVQNRRVVLRHTVPL